jgi:hypothetical protein
VHEPGQRFAQRVLGPREPYPQWPVRYAVEHLERHSWTDPERDEVGQRAAVPVVHPLHGEAAVRVGVGQAGAPALDVLVARPRDRVAVRILAGPLEQRVDAVEQPVGDGVPETAGGRLDQPPARKCS